MRSTQITRALLVPLLVCGLAACSASSGAEGLWGNPEIPGTASLELQRYGEFSGTDGCNLIGGDWSQSGNRIEFTDVGSTRMFCPDVDTWLSTATSATLEGNTMTFYDASNNKVGELTKN